MSTKNVKAEVRTVKTIEIEVPDYEPEITALMNFEKRSAQLRENYKKRILTSSAGIEEQMEAYLKGLCEPAYEAGLREGDIGDHYYGYYYNNEFTGKTIVEVMKDSIVWKTRSLDEKIRAWDFVKSTIKNQIESDIKSRNRRTEEKNKQVKEELERVRNFVL